jgi:hypothetical protein
LIRARDTLSGVASNVDLIYPKSSTVSRTDKYHNLH